MYFNSQPHEEADAKREVFIRIMLISTHSLTKRLTAMDATGVSESHISTHSLTKRLTMLIAWLIGALIFQLTASRRGWLIYIHFYSSLSYFNSQPHEEADTRFQYFLHQILISTHSLTKRLTAKEFWRFCQMDISTHSLTKRLTGPWSVPTPFGTFQLTASRRGWRRCSQPLLRKTHFNSQPHEEADVLRSSGQTKQEYFNSQPHEEADEQIKLIYKRNNISTHSLTKRLTMADLIGGEN